MLSVTRSGRALYVPPRRRQRGRRTAQGVRRPRGESFGQFIEAAEPRPGAAGGGDRSNCAAGDRPRPGARVERGDSSSRPRRPESIPHPTVAGTTKRGGHRARSDAGRDDGLRTARDGHDDRDRAPVFPCGVKLYVSHDDTEVRTQVIGRGPEARTFSSASTTRSRAPRCGRPPDGSLALTTLERTGARPVRGPAHLLNDVKVRELRRAARKGWVGRAPTG